MSMKDDVVRRVEVGGGIATVYRSRVLLKIEQVSSDKTVMEERS